MTMTTTTTMSIIVKGLETLLEKTKYVNPNSDVIDFIVIGINDKELTVLYKDYELIKQFGFTHTFMFRMQFNRKVAKQTVFESKYLGRTSVSDEVFQP